MLKGSIIRYKFKIKYNKSYDFLVIIMRYHKKTKLSGKKLKQPKFDLS